MVFFFMSHSVKSDIMMEYGAQTYKIFITEII